MRKLYHAHLSDAERTELEQVTSRAKRSARVITRARILLKAAEGRQDEEIVEAVGSSTATVARVRRRFVQGGLDAVHTPALPHPWRRSGSAPASRAAEQSRMTWSDLGRISR